MKIEHRIHTRTPFGPQETWITDIGNIDVWSDSDGYQWRFTGIARVLSGGVERYSSSGAAFEAARKMLESKLIGDV